MGSGVQTYESNISEDDTWILIYIFDIMHYIPVVMRWLSFKHCALGSKGVRVLGPHISKMSLQVLVFERCGLCDDCCPAISSIIKVLNRYNIR